jgi:hypothetical protein
VGFVIANAVVSQILCDGKWLTVSYSSALLHIHIHAPIDENVLIRYILQPLLFSITHYVLLYLKVPVSDLVPAETNNYRRLPLLYTALAAVFCFFTLPKSITGGNAAIALWALGSRAAVFVLLEKDISLQKEELSSSFALLERVSSRVLLILTVFVIALSRGTPFVLELGNPRRFLLVAVAEALFWIAFVILVKLLSLGIESDQALTKTQTCQNRYGLASLSYTYSALSARAFQGNDFWGATAPAGAAILALSQMRVLFPRMLHSWKILALLVLLPLVALVNNIYVSGRILDDVDWHSGFLNATDCSGPLHSDRNGLV